MPALTISMATMDDEAAGVVGLEGCGVVSAVAASTARLRCWLEGVAAALPAVLFLRAPHGVCSTTAVRGTSAPAGAVATRDASAGCTATVSATVVVAAVITAGSVVLIYTRARAGRRRSSLCGAAASVVGVACFEFARRLLTCPQRRVRSCSAGEESVDSRRCSDGERTSR